jgi:arsenate reductase
MRELGIDITTQYSKTVAELGDVRFDYVVTVCGHANETCPVFPARTRLIHRGFDDPPTLAAQAESEEETLALYRRVRDEIEAYVLTLPDALDKR